MAPAVDEAVGAAQRGVLKVSSVNSASNSSGVLGSVTPPKSVRWLHLVGGKRVREWQVSNR